MANERHKQTRPVGDEDLTGQRNTEEVNIRDGGVGPSGSDFNATGRIGGLGSTSDGMHSREEFSMGADDHVLEAMQIIDTNVTDTGINPYASGDVNERDAGDGE